MVAKDVALGFIENNLRYCARSGNFFWLHDRANGKVKAGSKAGSTTSKGYVQIKVFGKWLKAHRLVWLVETGDWPEDQLDHKNRVPSDNRFNNLRVCSNYENCLNRAANASSRIVGVTLDKKNQKWLAQTYISGVAKNLGRYDTVTQARAAYLEANKERLNE